MCKNKRLAWGLQVFTILLFVWWVLDGAQNLVVALAASALGADISARDNVVVIHAITAEPRAAVRALRIVALIFVMLAAVISIAYVAISVSSHLASGCCSWNALCGTCRPSGLRCSQSAC